MIKELRKINQKLIFKYQTDKNKLNRQLLIFNILKNEDCFFKLDIETAYNLLKDLEIENYKECYLEQVLYSKYSCI